MSSRTASEVRSSFLSFFKGKGHEVCPSASLIPQNDPTLMFVNAGMAPFKDVFTGKDRRPYTRATSSQKCIRISGKHNDLENVGVTARHHTFFEMLGNFSFGDYFKDDAIPFAWELITKEWGIPQDRLVITVFGGAEGVPADDEARAIWRKVTGFGDDRIIGIPGIPGDNFWQMGETGPCGPCTELHFFTGDGEPTIDTFGQEPTPDGKGWMEIWNLVFMQFNRSEQSPGVYELAPLPKPCVDTGAGLERVASVLQGKTSNYDTDLLRALVEKAAQISGKNYGASQSPDDVSMRVIADHARLTAFLMAEGITPDRAGRAYVLRRVMRRAIRHGHRLGIQKPFLHEVALEVVRTMGDAYPELVERKALITSATEAEEVRFRETLERGLKMVDEEVGRVKSAGTQLLSGDFVFKLYDTFGFPMDLTEVIARERDLHIDVAGYEKAMEEQRTRSEGSKLEDEAVSDVYRKALEALRASQGGSETAAVRFTGYDREDGEGKVLFLAKGTERADQPTDKVTKGDKVLVVVDVTPFYGESGGQVGDKGEIRTGSGLKIKIEDTQKPLTGLFVHLGEVVEGELEVGATVSLEVDHALRTATRRNHSATHLLHWALRTVVGESATQKGSLVGPDRLRFDYSASKPLTGEEIQRIEDLVNEKILLDAPVVTEVLAQTEAKKRGAMAIFEEKYGDVVRVLTMTKDSVELCGGTHARALGEIGLFKIVSDGGIAAGVRRIEAATGLNALAYVRKLEDSVKNASKLVKAGPNELPEKIEKLLDDTKKLEKELSETKRKLAMGGSGGGGIDDLAGKAHALPFGKALAVKVDVPDAAMLRELAEKLRDKLGDAVVLLGSVNGPKAQLVCTVSKSLTDRYKAGELIRPIAQILGGSGGGRPDMAQAGGTEIAKLDEALDKLYQLVS
ncbi:Alanyl-tRNA synthetase [Labilithrix luteola]|uniref:Alanine--tRNA ligase n=1 Tax=Labilithrix luteola TaxID=1391654 RepID=A0A0K1QD49_9BACT|nr:alanine--tRNA ligase [Labilithrix luteola]AKV03674.1 Alanyl-tRNA synthetase [Labilithrix luteola]